MALGFNISGAEGRNRNFRIPSFGARCTGSTQKSSYSDCRTTDNGSPVRLIRARLGPTNASEPRAELDVSYRFLDPDYLYVFPSLGGV